MLGSPIRQLRQPAITVDVQSRCVPRETGGHVVTAPDGRDILVVPKRLAVPNDVDDVLLVPAGSSRPNSQLEGLSVERASWLRPVATDPGDVSHDEWRIRRERVRSSWRDQFRFKEEVRDQGEVVERGLRAPQLGAVHATLGYWKATTEPGMIVMPTGTGKTETMLAILVHEQLDRLLVVVPSAALREQIADNFLTLGLLRETGVVDPQALYPIVGTLERRLKTPGEVDAYFGCCNVIVTTMQLVSGCSDDVQRRMAALCSHLFIDEAHHISAPTWEKFRRFFAAKTILQFTATPFRSDGKHVAGENVFTYPLRKAQEEGYFKPITFRPVRQYNRRRADEAIAKAAVEQLEADLANGFDHLVMARADNIARAEEIHALYARIAAAHHPLLVHSKQGNTERREALRRLREGEARIVVCVDMLGEGFDLPELKIAALHDIHKSLAITLQFTGRFTRTKHAIGDATVIANIADPGVEDSLRDLYAEDADWNHLLRELSTGATARQVRHSEFLGHFDNSPPDIPLQNIFPKMSTVVYRTRCARWRPDRLRDAINEAQFCMEPAINLRDRVALFVTQEHEPIAWGDIKELHNTTWHLYLLHWDEERGLLFVNSSNNESLHEDLAKVVAGDDVAPVRDELVFRSLTGIKRLILMNLGLKHAFSRATRFSMHVGNDIQQGLAPASLQNRIKSNVFGWGYEGGTRAGMGCSTKGRIWSYKIAADLSEWVEWCHHVGDKLLDETISIEEIFESVIIPEQIDQRPPLVPLVIEWSEDLLMRSEDAIQFDVAGEVVPFFEVGLDLVSHEHVGPIRFRIFTETRSVEYEVKFRGATVEYVPTGKESVDILVGRRRWSLTHWFERRGESPLIRFEDGSWLEYNQLYRLPKGERKPYDRARIDAWDWSGTNLGKESQRQEKRPDSIQFRVIQELLNPAHEPAYDIVFDDDTANEAADVVALKVADEKLIVHLYHLKFSKSDPGHRVKDLYEVCGQAQRSVFWKGDVDRLFDHLRHREELRLQSGGVSRFERGDLDRLEEIKSESRFLTPAFTIFIVQPGLSRAQAETSQLELLAVTELYLQETYAVPFAVIASA